MNMVTRPLSVLLILLMAGCAHLRPEAKAAKPVEGTVEQKAEQEEKDVKEAKEAAEAEKLNARLPKVPLSGDIVFGVLASEISAQRGNFGPSAATDLELAQRTGDPRLAQRAAEFALRAGQLQIATAALASWAKLDPESRPAREQLFITLLRTGHLAEAKPLVESLLEKEPDRVPAVFIELARLTPQQANRPTSFELVRELAGRYPQVQEARFAVIAIAAEANDQATVDAEFNRLAELSPKWDLPVAWYTDHLVRANKMDEGLSFLKRELARRPDAGFTLKMAYPRLLVANKRYEEARAGFAALHEQQPHNPDILFALGLLSFESKDYDAAEHYLKQALEAKYSSPDFVRLTLGQLAEARDKPAEARQWYADVGPSGEFLQAQVRLAQMEARDGLLDAAIKRLDGLGGNSQERIALAVTSSQLAREAKQNARAYQLVSAALTENKGAPDLLYERALVSESLGKIGDSERDLRDYLKQKPDDAQALNALGYTLANHTKRYKEAKALLEKALKVDPNSAAILDSMGWLQYKLGNLKESLSYLERAWKEFPDPEVGAHYGEVLWKLGRKNEAREVWSKGRANEPRNTVLNETIKRLAGEL